MSLAKHSVVVLISSLHVRFGSVNRLYVIAGGGRRAHGHGAAQLIGEFLKVVILNALSSQVFNGLISILDECLRASNWLLQHHHLLPYGSFENPEAEDQTCTCCVCIGFWCTYKALQVNIKKKSLVEG